MDLKLAMLFTIVALSLLLRGELPDFIKLMLLLRHDKRVLVDIEEIIADLLSRALVAVYVVAIRVACCRLRLFTGSIASHQNFVCQILCNYDCVVGRLIDYFLHAIAANFWRLGSWCLSFLGHL